MICEKYFNSQVCIYKDDMKNTVNIRVEIFLTVHWEVNRKPIISLKSGFLE